MYWMVVMFDVFFPGVFFFRPIAFVEFSPLNPLNCRGSDRLRYGQVF